MSLPPSHAILEAIITTEAEAGGMHVAPMGPEVDSDLRCWRLKPFQSSSTFANLKRTNRCIVHVVDDALLMAQAVLGRAGDTRATLHPGVGYVLEDANHWYALQVIEWDVSQPRALADCQVVDQAVVRPFFGWNRAKHAVIEAAILASRVGMLDVDGMRNDMARLKVMVDKTGGSREHEAWRILEEFIVSNAKPVSSADSV